MVSRSFVRWRQRTARGSRSWRRTAPTFNQVPVGDIDKFMEIVAALSLTSFRLARFQSPTLQAIAVAQQQSQVSSEPIHYEVHIHNARGEHIRTTIDGEVVEEPDMKLIESDRSDGPDA